MTRKNPDKRTAKRLKKLEDERQAKKVKICQYRIKGESYRAIGARFGMSHQAIANICNLLLVVVKSARKVFPVVYFLIKWIAPAAVLLIFISNFIL